jgi:hypothetical protein
MAIIDQILDEQIKNSEGENWFVNSAIHWLAIINESPNRKIN